MADCGGNFRADTDYWWIYGVETGGNLRRIRGGNRIADCGGNFRADTGGFTGWKQAEIYDGYAVEKTGRKCSQLDCDLRPYEQLWRARRRVKVKRAAAPRARLTADPRPISPIYIIRQLDCTTCYHYGHKA